MKYEYQGVSGNNPSIVGPIAKGDIVDEGRVQSRALDGLVKTGVLAPLKVKQLKGVPEEDKS